jgi:hypothetical protein
VKCRSQSAISNSRCTLNDAQGTNEDVSALGGEGTMNCRYLMCSPTGVRIRGNQGRVVALAMKKLDKDKRGNSRLDLS